MDVHKNVHRNVHSWNFLKSLWPVPQWPGRSRAAKPRRPTCRRRPLRARRVTSDHNGGGRPGHRPAWMPILGLATRSFPRQEGVGWIGAVGTDRCKCVKQFLEVLLW